MRAAVDALALALLLAAPCIGSFLGTLVLRLPAGRPVLLDRSRCACGRPLAAIELVPLLAWAMQRGRCRRCGAALGLFYPGIELAALAVPLWAMTEAADAALFASCLLGWGLLALAWIDRRDYLLPDALTLPLLALGLGATAWLAPAALLDHVLGAALAWLGLTVLAALYRRIRGEDGLGGGDAMLLAAGGAWLGWQGLPSVLVVASLCGLAEALLRRLGRRDAIAYGAWLALGIWLVWLYGPV
jgi:leader peptidase (prepilin peptidase)/N-methyltransferase